MVKKIIKITEKGNLIMHYKCVKRDELCITNTIEKLISGKVVENRI